MTNTFAARVRLSETDARGCIDDISLLVLFEAARADGLRELGLPYSEIVARGFNALTVEARLINHACAHVDDLIVVHMTAAEVGRLRFSFDYNVRRVSDNALIAAGETTHIFLDAARNQPARLPEWLRNALLRLREPLANAP